MRRRRSWTRGFLRRGGGVPLGSRPGEAWLRNRYLGPYQRDMLLDRGIAVETLETATTWSRLAGLHVGVRAALSAALSGRGTPPLVTSHVSLPFRLDALPPVLKLLSSPLRLWVSEPARVTVRVNGATRAAVFPPSE